MAILANAICLGVELDHRSPVSDVKIGWWFIIDSIFTTIFLAECVLRLAADGRRFHRDPWNVFDALLAVLGVVDTWLLYLVFLVTGENATDVRLLTASRLLRLMRLSRILRVLRLLRFFKELLLLTRAIGGAVAATFWSALLLAMVILMFGIFLTRLVTGQCCGEDYDFKHDKFLDWFGTMPRSLFTLFSAATLEGYPEIARLAFDQGASGVVLVVSLMFFVLLTHLLVLNLVTGFFIENVLDIAAAEEIRNEQRTRLANKLRVWELLNNSGEEFSSLLEHKDLLERVRERSHPGRLDRIMEWFGALTYARQYVKAGSAAKLKRAGSSCSSQGSDSVSAPVPSSRLALAAQFAGVSELEAGQIFELLDLQPEGQAGSVRAEQFVDRLVDHAVPPDAWDVQELACDIAKVKAKVKHISHQLQLLEGVVLEVADRGVVGRPSPPATRDDDTEEELLAPDLAQLRKEMLDEIHAKEEELAARIPKAIAELRKEALDGLEAVEARVAQVAQLAAPSGPEQPA